MDTAGVGLADIDTKAIVRCRIFTIIAVGIIGLDREIICSSSKVGNRTCGCISNVDFVGKDSG